MITKEAALVAIDIKRTTGSYAAIASYRIPDEMLAWLKGLEGKTGVIGFVYDGTYNFQALLDAPFEKAADATKVARKKAVRVTDDPNPLG